MTRSFNNTMLFLSATCLIAIAPTLTYARPKGIKLKADDLPVVIDKSGEYFLKSGVTITDPNQTVIVITVPDVKLDLGGKTIQGPITCTGLPAVCSGSGTGKGVDASGVGGVAVTNGAVKGMGSHGLHLGGEAEVKNVVSSQNGANGLLAGEGAKVENVKAVRNAANGLEAGDNSNFTENKTTGNGLCGIDTAAGGKLIRNTTGSNTVGLRAGASTLVKNNVIRGNQDKGGDFDVRAVNLENKFDFNTTDFAGGICEKSFCGTALCAGCP